MLKLLVITLLFWNAAPAIAFDCQNEPITPQMGLTGTIPKGATSVVNVPAGTHCKYQFVIPKGSALKMEITTYYDIYGDSVTFEDYIFPPYDGVQLDYVVEGPVALEINSTTGNFTFIATYTYVDISNYKQKVVPTGTFFNITLEPNTYYTMRASEGNTATFNLAMLHTGFSDRTISNVFVYDGEDIMNSEYVGLLSRQLKYFNMHSDTRSFTFLNLYGESSYSYLLGNDYAKVKDWEQYRVGVVDPVKLTTDYFTNDIISVGHPDAYYTYICDGCDGFYLEYLLFDSNRWNNTDGFVEIRGLSPTQGLPPVVKYTYSLNNNASFPLYIPAPMATFYIHKAAVNVAFKKDSSSTFQDILPSDKRSVYSSNLWNPPANSQFDYKFTNPSSLQTYNFSITLENIKLQDNDELHVQVSSVDGLTTLDKKYTKTSLSNVGLSGEGRYLQLTYNGGPDSNVAVNFEMIDPSAPTDSPKSSLATSPATVGSTVTTTPTPSTVTTVTTPSTVPQSSTVAPTVSTSTVASTVSQTTVGKTTVSTVSTGSTVTLPSTVLQSSTIAPITVASKVSSSSTAPTTSLPSTVSQNSTGSTATMPTIQTTTSGASSLGLLVISITALLH